MQFYSLLTASFLLTEHCCLKACYQHEHVSAWFCFQSHVRRSELAPALLRRMGLTHPALALASLSPLPDSSCHIICRCGIRMVSLVNACMMPCSVVLCTLVACHRNCPEQLRLHCKNHGQSLQSVPFLYLVQSHPS